MPEVLELFLSYSSRKILKSSSTVLEQVLEQFMNSKIASSRINVHEHRSSKTSSTSSRNREVLELAI